MEHEYFQLFLFRRLIVPFVAPGRLLGRVCRHGETPGGMAPREMQMKTQIVKSELAEYSHEF